MDRLYLYSIYRYAGDQQAFPDNSQLTEPFQKTAVVGKPYLYGKKKAVPSGTAL
jgi:hypothetical protein